MNPPCTRTPPLSRTPHRRAARGTARLEFALVVAATGVIIVLALSRLGELQVLGRDVHRQTVAAQERAASALSQARCPATTAASAAQLPSAVFPCP